MTTYERRPTNRTANEEAGQPEPIVLALAALVVYRADRQLAYKFWHVQHSLEARLRDADRRRAVLR